jgi:hypothetical protein
MTTSAHGWAVHDEVGLRVETVGPTRRSAIVNWLYVFREMSVSDIWSDTCIEEVFKRQCADGLVKLVEVHITEEALQ